MSDVDFSETQPLMQEYEPRMWLVVARHIVGLFIVMGVIWFYYPPANFIRWAVIPVSCVVLAALVAALLALFFTDSQAKKSARNFVMTLWVLGFGYLGVAWVAHLQDKVEAGAASNGQRQSFQFDPSTARPVDRPAKTFSYEEATQPAQAPNPFADPNFGKPPEPAR